MSGQATKTFVLDTSVLLSAGKQAFSAFEEHRVVIPLIVVTELEGKRNDPELGLMARSALRGLEDLRLKNGPLVNVSINDQGGTLSVEVNHVSREDLPEALKIASSHDARILAVAYNLNKETNDVVVVTQDTPMRILAGGVLGLQAEEYSHNFAKSAGYSGIDIVETESDVVDALYQGEGVLSGEVDDYPVNQGLIVRSGSSHSALAVKTSRGRIEAVNGDREVFGVRGRSVEQRIAIDHLLNDDIDIVSLGGTAGTGKTMLALAAGLEKILESSPKERRFDKIIVFRNMHAVGGEDLGFLPGSEAEKMDPWTAAIYDALGAVASQTVLDEIKDRNILEVLPLTHIRGRTFTKTWMIVDECQNLERSVILTALSRLGHNSKAIMSWDVSQRDNLRVGRHDGIYSVVERLRGQSLFAHVTLTKSERSRAAELVSRLLDGDDF